MPARVFVKEHLNGHHDWRRRRYAARHLELPADLELLRTPRDEDSVWAVGIVHNEDDVLRLCVDHLWAQGFDRMLVVDHKSTDGTADLLAELARADPRIGVARYPLGGFYQSELMTTLARVVRRLGAGWLVPVDADEFWFADGQSVSEFLRAQSADVVQARRFNAIPLDDQLTTGTLVAFCPAPILRKVAFRPHPLALVAPGNHGVAQVGEVTTGLRIVHLPYRDPQRLLAKFRDGAQALEGTGVVPEFAWHWKAGSRWSGNEAEAMWQAMRRGEPVPEIGWTDASLDLTARPLRWHSWDPDAMLPTTDDGAGALV
jgi:hypothetical protein